MAQAPNFAQWLNSSGWQRRIDDAGDDERGQSESPRELERAQAAYQKQFGVAPGSSSGNFQLPAGFTRTMADTGSNENWTDASGTVRGGNAPSPGSQSEFYQGPDGKLYIRAGEAVPGFSVPAGTDERGNPEYLSEYGEFSKQVGGRGDDMWEMAPVLAAMAFTGAGLSGALGGLQGIAGNGLIGGLGGGAGGATAEGVGGGFAAAPDISGSMLQLGGEVGGGLASEAGFVPGSFEIGASGYGGTAAAGLDAAAAEWAAMAGGGLPNLPPGGQQTLQQFMQNQGAGSSPDAIRQLAQTGNGLGIGDLAGAAGTAGSAFSRILDGTATEADWLSAMGTAGSTALGVMGSNAQADAYKDVADKFFALGAPGREQYDRYTAPGFDVGTLPGLKSAMETSADVQGRAWSSKVGNPALNPTAQIETQKYLMGNLALPQYNTAISQALTRGGMGVNQAGTGAMAGASQAGGLYDALGGGLARLTTPDNTGALEDILKKLQGGGGGYKLNMYGLT